MQDSGLPFANPKVPTVCYLRFSIYVTDPAEDSSYRDRFLYISYLISFYYYCGTKVVKAPILQVVYKLVELSLLRRGEREFGLGISVFSLDFSLKRSFRSGQGRIS